MVRDGSPKACCGAQSRPDSIYAVKLQRRVNLLRFVPCALGVEAIAVKSTGLTGSRCAWGLVQNSESVLGAPSRQPNVVKTE